MATYFPVGQSVQSFPFNLASANVSSFDRNSLALTGGNTLTVDVAPWNAISTSLSPTTTPIWFGDSGTIYNFVHVCTGTALTITAVVSGLAPSFLRIYSDVASSQLSAPPMIAEYALTSGMATVVTHAWFPSAYCRVQIVNASTSGISLSNISLSVVATGAS
jgi:hypothetical protein